jgi:hypothetical protein
MFGHGRGQDVPDDAPGFAQPYDLAPFDDAP